MSQSGSQKRLKRISREKRRTDKCNMSKILWIVPPIVKNIFGELFGNLGWRSAVETQTQKCYKLQVL